MPLFYVCFKKLVENDGNSRISYVSQFKKYVN